MGMPLEQLHVLRGTLNTVAWCRCYSRSKSMKGSLTRERCSVHAVEQERGLEGSRLPSYSSKGCVEGCFAHTKAIIAIVSVGPLQFPCA